MKDNWYEASVSASAPHRIIAVVDWASDSPIPTEPTTKQPATYNVFPWGINDPAEGNRSIEKENYDSLASPVGWHSLPYANDPQSANVKSKKPTEFWRNTTTTFGNNVSYSPLDNVFPYNGADILACRFSLMKIGKAVITGWTIIVRTPALK